MRLGWVGVFQYFFSSLIYYSFSLLSLRFIFFMVVENSLRCVEVVLVTHIPSAFTNYEDRAASNCAGVSFVFRVLVERAGYIITRPHTTSTLTHQPPPPLYQHRLRWMPTMSPSPITIILNPSQNHSITYSPTDDSVTANLPQPIPIEKCPNKPKLMLLIHFV